MGRDLTITSTQDSDDYNSKQTSISGGASFSFGSMTGSGSLSASRDKIHSNYDSVQEQSGIFAGSGGFDVTVGNHTQLDGGAITSTATPDKNSLDTGTLGWSDIHNSAEFESQHSGAGISTGGSVGENFLGNMGNVLAVAGGNSGNAEGTTKAAISEGSITVRDKDNQQQDVATLSRDVENANGSIAPIFDKEKEQQRLQEVQLIAEIGNQVGDIARTQGEITALNAGKAELAKRGLNEPGQDASTEEKAHYQKALAESPAYKAAMQEWGTGSDIQRAIQAATGAVQGLAGGDIAAALAGASAPQLAHMLKPTEDNTAINTLAHAILGGAVASLQGSNALAGAAGAASAELAARAIMASLYPGKKADDLTETEKQKVSALATVAAGLAGGITGDSSASAVAGAQGGKNAVENNALGNVLAAAEANKTGTIDKWQEQQQAAIREACSGDTPISCETAVAGMGSIMAWPLLPGFAATTSLVGAGANAGIGLLINGEVNPNDVIFAYWTGAFTAGTGLWGTIGVNAITGGASSYLKGDDPLKGGALSGAASGLGYGFGKIVQGQFDKALNPNWKNWAWENIGVGISRPMPLEPLPGVFGNTGAALGTEVINNQVGKVDANELKGEKK